MTNSVCEQPPFDYRNFQPTESGMERNYAEISINRGRNCHLEWLVYLIEDEQYPGSTQMYSHMIAEADARPAEIYRNETRES